MQVSPRISGEKPGHLRFPSFSLAVGPWETPENSPKARYPMYRYLPTHRLAAPPREGEKLAIGRQRRDQAIHGLGPQMVGGSRYWGVAHLDGPYRN